MAEASERGWRFAHGLLRESLCRQAESAGRWAEHNETCAKMLVRRFQSPSAGDEARIGSHFAEGGRAEDALEYWQRASRRFFGYGDYEAAEQWARRVEEAGDGMGLDAAHPDTLRARVMLSACHVRHGRIDEARELLDVVFEGARERNNTSALGSAYRMQADLRIVDGERAEALELCRKSLELHREADEPYDVAVTQG